MSDTANQPPLDPSPPQGDGCLSAIMILGGLILLLPGLCFSAVFLGPLTQELSNVWALLTGAPTRGSSTGLANMLLYFSMSAGAVVLGIMAIMRAFR